MLLPTLFDCFLTASPSPSQSRLGLCGVEDPAAVAAEVKSTYERLMQLDPMRAGFYKDALEGRAFVVVSALGTV